MTTSFEFEGKNIKKNVVKIPSLPEPPSLACLMSIICSNCVVKISVWKTAAGTNNARSLPRGTVFVVLERF